MSFHQTKRFICTEDYPIVETPKGKIHGYVDNDIFCFHGIDYGRASAIMLDEFRSGNLGRITLESAHI